MRSFPPIYLWRDAGTREAVGDVLRAAEWLLERWPQEFSSTPLHRAARIACLKALEEDDDPMEARNTLIAAAEEADILAGTEGPDFSKRATRPTKRARRA